MKPGAAITAALQEQARRDTIRLWFEAVCADPRSTLYKSGRPAFFIWRG